MKRVAVASLLVVSLLLAGCNDDEPRNPQQPREPDEPDEPDEPRQPTPPRQPMGPRTLLTALDFTGCQGVQVRIPAAMEDVQAMLPENYTAEPLVGGADAVAALYADIFACGNLTTGSIVVPSIHVGHLWTYIEPVAGYDADDHEYVFQMLAPPGLMQQLWLASGYDVVAGETNLTFEDPGGLGLAARASAMVGDVRFDADGATSPDDTGTRTFARFTEIEQGLITWTGTATVTAAYAGQGAVTFTGTAFEGHPGNGAAFPTVVDFTDQHVVFHPATG